MRTKACAGFTILAVLALIGTVAAGPPPGNNEKFVSVEGSAWMIAPPEGGEVKCIGGTPVAAWPPCTPGSKVQIRNMKMTFWQKFDGPDAALLHDGVRTIMFNANFDPAGKGHAWGTWRVELPSGTGIWEGVFTASPTMWDGPNAGKVTGQGTEGVVDGMQVRLLVSYDNFPGLETMEGYYFKPSSRK